MKRAGEYQIDALEILSHNGFVMDVSNIMMAFELYEDIYSPSLSARLALVSTEDLAEVLPLIGQELVNISLDHTGGSDEPINLTMVVHKVSGYQREQQGTKMILELITTDMISNFTTKISKYFEKPASQIVQEVIGLMGSSKQVEVIESNDEQKIVVPNFTPFKTCNWMSTKAFYGDSASYLFFETKKNYVFKPLTELTQQQRKTKYFDGAQNVDSLDPNMENKSIQKYNITSMFDVTSNIMKGMYSASAVKVDIIARSFETINYDYWNQYSEVPHLTENQLFDVSGQGTQYRTANKYVLPENQLLTYFHDETNLKRRSQLQLFDNLKMELTVFGDTSLSAGDLIELSIPLLNPQGSGKENQRLSGNWVISAIKHRFEREGYYADIECVRDSTNKPLPQPQPTLQ